MAGLGRSLQFLYNMSISVVTDKKLYLSIIVRSKAVAIQSRLDVRFDAPQKRIRMPNAE
jgi:hypothetical protein